MSKKRLQNTIRNSFDKAEFPKNYRNQLGILSNYYEKQGSKKQLIDKGYFQLIFKFIEDL